MTDRKTVKEIYGSEYPIILAPMAGVTDLPFRLLCREQGADAVVTEMISAKALYYGNRNTIPLMKIEEEEKPVGVQIFGSDPVLMGEQAGKIEDRGFSFIDINMGCPVPKIVNNHEGSSLMLHPDLAGRIVEEVVRHVHLPVTVKIRKGFDEDHVNAVEFAQVLEQAGASAIAVHGRTRTQYYGGKADWDIIRKVKEKVSVPVIGNGDIFSGDDGVRMRDCTGCDGIMAARGARGNPWLFRELKARLEGKTAPERPGREEIITTVIRQTRLCAAYKGEYTAIREMRKHVAWYTAGIRGAARMREAVNRVNSVREIEELLSR